MPSTDEARPASAPASPLVRIARYGLRRGNGFGEHQHPDAQLVWGVRGVLRVRVGDDRWTLAPGHAAWIPGGAAHDVVAVREADLCCAYVDPARCPPGLLPPGPTALEATPLFRELVGLLGREDVEDETRALAELLLFRQLRPADAPTVTLRRPRDDRSVLVADALRADPADDRTLAEWGRVAGASGRTLARLFVAETGLPFAAWRTRLRIAVALDLLADGLPVSTVAGRVGYATPSAFVAAFRRETGTTPGRAHGA
jgi:AraC-like DNA-binding protein